MDWVFVMDGTYSLIQALRVCPAWCVSIPPHLFSCCFQWIWIMWPCPWQLKHWTCWIWVLQFLVKCPCLPKLKHLLVVERFPCWTDIAVSCSDINCIVSSSLCNCCLSLVWTWLTRSSHLCFTVDKEELLASMLWLQLKLKGHFLWQCVN